MVLVRRALAGAPRATPASMKKKLSLRIKAFLQGLFPADTNSLPSYPGVTAFLNALQQHGVLIGSNQQARSAFVSPLLEGEGLLGYFRWLSR